MSLQQFTTIVRARWRSGFAVLLAVLAVAALIHLLTPKRYTAQASVIIDIKSPDPIAGAALQGLTSPSYMATQVDVLRSQRAAQRVVQLLQLENNPTIRAQWLDATRGATPMELWGAQALGQALDVRPSRGSNVINVAFTAGDPTFAAQAANAFVQAYLDLSVDLRTDPARQYSVFFDQRAKQLRDKLEEAQARLSGYQREKGLLATDERMDVETARLNELSTQLTALQAVAAESGGRQAQAATNAERMQEVLASPLISGLTADLSRQEAKLKELSSRLGDRHPQVIETRESIGELRRRIGVETNRISGSLNVANSINQGRVAQLQAALKEQRAKLLKMREQRDEAAVLLRDVENAQKAYDGVVARAGSASLESQAGLTNVARLESAVEPTRPSSMGLRKSLALALVFGGLLAVATMCVRELRDRRLRSEFDVAQLLRQPLLGTLPAIGRRAEARPKGIAALLPGRVAGLLESRG
ncbi:MAG TPA: chain length determinant protein EpsF [Methylibium sp.]|uniref:chain length determinant protein EpsF n=1 Tax=Methylibium sp. TaxID=2067992 RepID=UPI002DBC187F|nr:chain length determinant protein EpsF [Methylibium sp.]HEU4459920.1 chain length determinant protein EpsF [Methylibium sp.]